VAALLEAGKSKWHVRRNTRSLAEIIIIIIMDASAYFLYQGWFGIRSLPTPFQFTRLLNALHSIFNALNTYCLQYDVGTERMRVCIHQSSCIGCRLGFRVLTRPWHMSQAGRKPVHPGEGRIWGLGRPGWWRAPVPESTSPRRDNAKTYE
jgi:hypothetical protein